ncbi:hypothetical protein ACLB2K_064851 [Fragaria x ananassa]
MPVELCCVTYSFLRISTASQILSDSSVNLDICLWRLDHCEGLITMNSIVEIHPKELKFVVELMKQSKCSIRLTNKSDRHVAFKVKTTSPKKYCVRPNVGVILPKSYCEFSVTMQALKTALPDIECKDKFLIQSTAVSSETTDADITASMFAKDEGKYVEEKKLRVFYISPPDSPMLSPIKVDLKQGQGHEASMLNDPVFSGVETLPPHKMVSKDGKFRAVNSEESKPSKETEVKPAKHVEMKVRKEEELKPAEAVELKPTKYEALEATEDVESKSTNAADMEPAKDVELKSAKVVELEPAKDMELNHAKNVEMKPSEALLLKRVKDVEADKAHVVEDLKLVKDIEEMKSKLLELELKLCQAEVTISKLTEERSLSIQEIKDLKEQLGYLSKGGVQRVEFPVIFACTVALFSILLVIAIAVKSLSMKTSRYASPKPQNGSFSTLASDCNSDVDSILESSAKRFFSNKVYVHPRMAATLPEDCVVLPLSDENWVVISPMKSECRMDH